MVKKGPIILGAGAALAIFGFLWGRKAKAAPEEEAPEEEAPEEEEIRVGK